VQTSRVLKVKGEASEWPFFAHLHSSICSSRHFQNLMQTWQSGTCRSIQ
jgi:hypothetical protein